MNITLGKNQNKSQFQLSEKSPYLCEFNNYLKNLNNIDDFLKFPLTKELINEVDIYGNKFLHYIGLFLEELTVMVSREKFSRPISIKQNVTRVPVVFNPSQTIQHHTLIIGQSGTGRSLLLEKKFEFFLKFKNESQLYESMKDSSLEDYVIQLINYINENNLHDICEKTNYFDEKPYQVYQNNLVKLWESMVNVHDLEIKLPINENEESSKKKI